MSVRRAARTAAAALSELPGSPPCEMLDADHPVWADDELYRAFCGRMGYERNDLPVAERLQGSSANPSNRRNCASVAWGRHNGISSWHQLRTMGLIDC
jgi:hypothetical protein